MIQKTFTTESGEVLPIIAVSDVALAPITRKLGPRKPNPPVEEIDTADGIKSIPNEAHPDYLRKLEEYISEFNSFALASYIELGVFIKLDADQLAKAQWMQTKFEMINPGAPENKFLTYLYIVSICPSVAELLRLYEAIKNINNPTQEQVQTHLADFRSGVQGQALDGDQDAAVGDSIAVGVN